MIYILYKQNVCPFFFFQLDEFWLFSIFLRLFFVSRFEEPRRIWCQYRGLSAAHFATKGIIIENSSTLWRGVPMTRSLATFKTTNENNGKAMPRLGFSWKTPTALYAITNFPFYYLLFFRSPALISGISWIWIREIFHVWVRMWGQPPTGMRRGQMPNGFLWRECGHRGKSIV